MLQVCISLQTASVIISFIVFLLIFSRWSAKEHAYLVLLMLAVTVSNIGYLRELYGISAEDAFIGTTISYLGKVFILYLFLLYSMEVCRIRIPDILKCLLAFFQCGLYIVVMTTGRHGLYYSGSEYVKEGVFPHVVYSHGYLYYVHIATLILYSLLNLAIMIRCYCKDGNDTLRKRVKTLILIMLINISGLALFFTGICKGFDTTSVAFTLMSIILLYSILYEDFMGTVEFAKDVVVDNLNIGIAVTDTNSAGIYTNVMAREVMKNIESIKPEDRYREMARYAKAGIRREYNGHVYQFDMQELKKFNHVSGYIYNIHDVTEDARYAEILENAITEKTSDVKHMQHSIIASFADMVEARDTVTGTHVKNTSEYVRILVNGLSEKEGHTGIINRQYAQNTIDAAPLHDIGKIAISDTILKKPGKLTPEEFEQIKVHSRTGADIIEQTLATVEEPAYLNIARDMALYHHERWDGKGYPEGISGETIPLCARVMAIADVYDALRSKRSYKERFSKEKSREIIKEGAGTQFDPKLVEIFFENIEEIEAVDA